MRKNILNWYELKISINFHKNQLFYYFLQIALKNCFIRGSTVRYVHIKPDDVDTELMLESC